MKKLFILTAILVTSLAVLSQKRLTYISASITPTIQSTPIPSYGFEVGRWGVESKTTLGVVAAYTPVSKDFFIGLKPYLTLSDNGRISTMIYIAPQVRLTHKAMFVMEEGIGANFTISRRLLFGLYAGAQQAKEYNFVGQLSAGIVALFPEKKAKK